MLLRVRMRYFMGLSAVATLEILHEGDERLHALQGHGVVEAGAHAADRAVALETDEPRGLRLAEKGGIELRGRQREGHVHPRAAMLRHRIAVEAGLIDAAVEELRLGAIARRHGLESPLSMQPPQHQAADVPAESRWRVE